MKLKNRKALVTGASRGIGRAIALALAEEGAAVACGARNRAQLDELAAAIETRGGEALAVALDVTAPESIAAARDTIHSRLGLIEILVNNAGIAGSSKVISMDDAHWQEHLDINLTGAFRVTRAFLPDVFERGWGRIINIASTAGKVGYLYTAAYCASKHGLVGFTRALALEVASSKASVTANAICPGFVATEMADRAATKIAAKTGKTEAEATAALARMSPQNRMIEAEEVAALAVMLASEDARGINGQAINIDGGAVVY